MANQLFAKKPLKMLLEEMAGEHRLRRVLADRRPMISVEQIAVSQDALVLEP
ncbi:MAG: hypothetical protein AABO41_10725 [Acidobacteriota bacterium]